MELTGVSEDEIVQVYLACGKNMEVAESNLIGNEESSQWL